MDREAPRERRLMTAASGQRREGERHAGGEYNPSCPRPHHEAAHSPTPYPASGPRSCIPRASSIQLRSRGIPPLFYPVDRCGSVHPRLLDDLAVACLARTSTRSPYCRSSVFFTCISARVTFVAASCKSVQPHFLTRGCVAFIPILHRNQAQRLYQHNRSKFI